MFNVYAYVMPQLDALTVYYVCFCIAQDPLLSIQRENKQLLNYFIFNTDFVQWTAAGQPEHSVMSDAVTVVRGEVVQQQINTLHIYYNKLVERNCI